MYRLNRRFRIRRMIDSSVSRLLTYSPHCISRWARQQFHKYESESNSTEGVRSYHLLASPLALCQSHYWRQSEKGRFSHQRVGVITPLIKCPPFKCLSVMSSADISFGSFSSRTCAAEAEAKRGGGEGKLLLLMS